MYRHLVYIILKVLPYKFCNMKWKHGLKVITKAEGLILFNANFYGADVICNFDICYKFYLIHIIFFFFCRTNESTTSLRHDSVGNGYTTTPCNNLSNQINMQGNQIDHSKNNLLVNLPTKNEIEKNNVINSSSSAHSGSGSSSAGSNNSTATTATTVIHNGTLPRNATGTLCKKVYL